MEYKKRCTNCGKYPFCKDTLGASHCCDNWIKRNCEIIKEEVKNNGKV